jgi:hypothetical protein
MRYHVPATDKVADLQRLDKSISHKFSSLSLLALVCEPSLLINQDLNNTPVYNLKLLQSSIVIGHVGPAEMLAV